MPGSSTSARTLPGGTGRSPTSLAAISPRPPRQTFYGWYDEEKAAYDEAVASGSYPGLAGMSAFEVSRQYPDLYLRVGHYLNIIDSDYTVTGFAWNSVNNTFDQVFDNPAGPGGATYGVSEYRSLYETWYATLIDSGLDVKIDIARDSATRAQAAYDDAYVAARSIDDARIEQREVDQTYTADMTDPDNGISGLAARKVWRSIPSQLLRSSTKKSNTLRSSAVDAAQSSLNRWIGLRQRESFPSTP